MFKFFIVLLFIVVITPVVSSANSHALANNQLTMDKSTIDITNIDKNSLQQLSKEEQKWYAKFQNGLTFFDGWKQISKDILSCLPEDEKPASKILLSKLGIRIGTEWSKSNKIRKIDTDQLHSWGKRIRKARKDGAKELSDTVALISREVDAILSQDISASLADNIE